LIFLYSGIFLIIFQAGGEIGTSPEVISLSVAFSRSLSISLRINLSIEIAS